MTRKWFHLALVSVVAAAAALSVAASTTSAGTRASRTGTSAASGVQQIGNVTTTLKINKFVRHGRRLVALGTAVSHFQPTPANPAGLQPATTSQPFTATVNGLRRFDSTQRICPILSLTLARLDLNLLGLLVHLDRVHLTITANSRGGVLGSLFCSLAHARVSLAQKAKSLTKVTQHSSLHTKGISLGVPLYKTASGSLTTGQGTLSPLTICPILDLTLGPLDLNLLGLMVHLDVVHLVITADSTGGVLGSLLCSLAGGAPSG
jgi:hypothetical protein